MCGRYAITSSPEALRALLGYLEQPNFPPRFNIAPTQPVPVVHLGDDGLRHFSLMRWGFVPGWVKDLKDWPLVINIRSETVREKASFRAAFLRRRALMPVDGFYEWDPKTKPARPYLLRRPDGAPFAFPALWETWHSADGSEIDTAALINTSAHALLARIHPRSPVILDPADHARWLDPATTAEEAAALLRPPPDDLLEMVPIGMAVNKVANDGPELQDRLDDWPPAAIEKAERPKPAARRKASGGSDQGSLF
jgi:putative SOS response-associated peptidase YedK